MSESERGWEKTGQILVVILLVSLALRIGSIVGAYRETRHKAEAFDSLNHALEVIDGVGLGDDVDTTYEALDAVTDDIRDALAWMEKRP